MKKTKNATSIAEAMVVMLIVVTWIIWIYKIYDSSNKLVINVTNKIQAIQIAREWIEAFTNIRDTNWLMFSSDYKNCWSTLNYNTNCIWATDKSHNIEENVKYKIYRNSENRWELWTDGTITWTSYSDTDYRDYYKIWFDNNWLYTQSGTISELKPIFIREISINYLDWITDQQKLSVKSSVSWSDSSSNQLHNIELDSTLTNWKNKTN